ncbi:MAG: spore cortex biosynthesis protein YabQ [Oscillospiraceae bacterium]
MGIDNIVQMQTFFNGMVIGCFLGAVFDVFKIIRITVNCSKLFVLIQDFIFSLIVGFISIFYIVFFGDGYIRTYIIFAEIIGFLLYNYVISPVVIGFYTLIFSKVKGFFKVISVRIIRPVFLVIIKFKNIVKIPLNKTDEKLKKISKINKFNLKRRRLMLYNLINIHKKSAGVRCNNEKTVKTKHRNKRKDIS